MKEEFDKRKLKLRLRVERKHLTCELLKSLKDLHELLPLIIWPGRPEIVEYTNKTGTILEEIKTLSTAVLKDLHTMRALYQNVSAPLVPTPSYQVEFHKVMNRLEKLMNQRTDEKGYYKDKQAWKYKNHDLLSPHSSAAKKLPSKS